MLTKKQSRARDAVVLILNKNEEIIPLDRDYRLGCSGVRKRKQCMNENIILFDLNVLKGDVINAFKKVKVSTEQSFALQLAPTFDM